MGSCTSVAAASTGVDCSTATCGSVFECANDKCSSQVDSCLADSTCASAQACVFGCSCGDVACAAACAASSGSSLANNVITCLSSSCTSVAATSTGVDCSAATCSSVCACANDKCSSQLTRAWLIQHVQVPKRVSLAAHVEMWLVLQLGLHPADQALRTMSSRAYPRAAHQWQLLPLELTAVQQHVAPFAPSPMTSASVRLTLAWPIQHVQAPKSVSLAARVEMWLVLQ